MYKRKSLLIIVAMLLVVFGDVSAKKQKVLTDEEILIKLDDALEKLPEKIKNVPEDVRRISFYSIRVDKEDISRNLFRQVQGKIESKFLEFPRPVLIYAPEVKPVKIVAKADRLHYASAFQTTEDIKSVSRQLRLDGFLEGSLYVTPKGLYLNLRIIDSESMAVVWSQSFDSIIPPEQPAPKTTGADFGFGVSGMFLSGTAPAGVTLPQYAKYYNTHMRISQKLSAKTRLCATLTGCIQYLYEGISASRTVVSAASGKGTFNLVTSIGIRVPVIPVDENDKTSNRDWLAVELKVGRIWALKNYGNNVYGLRIESDITKNLTVAAGVSYAGLKDVEYTTGSTVKTGGIMYEVSLLQFNYRP
ncbi:MAG: hypothetical protein ABIH89_10150 [Elusimicrobiota bacterium]